MNAQLVRLSRTLVFFVTLSPSILISQPGTGQSTKEPQNPFKNVQVLKGIADPELQQIMTFVRSSLGVRCDYCHVNSRETGWQYEKDDKKQKQTARKMFQMVLDINKTNFEGHTDVTCYTCHAGQTKPLTAPPLPVVPPQFTERGQGNSRRDSLPTPEVILKKYSDAVGTPDAVSHLSSKVMTGTVSGGDGKPNAIEVYQKGPNKLLAVITIPQGTIKRCYDGTTAWGITPRGPMELSDHDRDQLKASADLLHDIDLKKQFASMTTAAKDKIDDRDVYVVRGRIDERSSERLFFDVETGLLRRRVLVSRTMIANIPEQVDLEDYRDVGGLKIPFKVRYSYVDAGISSTRQFSEIKLNAAIEDEKFVAPK